MRVEERCQTRKKRRGVVRRRIRRGVRAIVARCGLRRRRSRASVGRE
jgi:hypothetical protein